MVDSEYLDLIPYEEVEHPVRRRSSILGFGGSGISSNNLTSGVITGGDESGDFNGSDSDAMAGIAAGYSATTLLTVTSIAALTGVMLARILS
eukprot:711-Heterococcus_DN1.PRE.4